MLTAPTSSELVEKTFGMDPDPLRVDQGTSFSFLVSDSDRAALLNGMEPSGAFMDWLFENGIEDVVPVSEPLLDAGNTINGDPWGWYLAEGRWIFAPLSEPESPASADAWMSASMTGAVISTGFWCWGTTALFWYSDDSGTSDFTIHYGVEPTEWDLLIYDVCGSLLEGQTLCPTCEDEDASGWEVSVDASAIFADSVIGKALTFIWCPCEAHDDQGTVLEAADRLWVWKNQQWDRRSS